MNSFYIVSSSSIFDDFANNAFPPHPIVHTYMSDICFDLAKSVVVLDDPSSMSAYVCNGHCQE